MPSLLLLNPVKARKMAKKTGRKAHRSAAQRRATAKLVALNRRGRVGRNPAKRRRPARRANPVAHSYAAPRRARRARRSNPTARRRRRNPISMGMGGSSVLSMLKGAAVGGAGAVAMDVAIGQINKFLPASLLGQPNVIDQGDAVKAGLTILLGKLLAKPTRGYSLKAANASLLVQAYNLIGTFVPASLPLGYYSPGPVVNATPRVGPNVRRMANTMGQYTGPGGNPLLSRYVSPGGTSPLLSRSPSSREREGFRWS
jgi:hypothetical protein